MDLETIEQLEAKHNIHFGIMLIENSINKVYNHIEGHRQPELNANQLKWIRKETKHVASLCVQLYDFVNDL